MRAKKREFKKKVVLSTGSIFVCTCIVALIFSWNEKPTEVFTYIIPTAGGVFGAAVIWYLKAVQLENGIKIQLGMIKKLIDMGEENPAEDRTGKKGYGMGLAYRKIPGYHIIFNRRKIRRTVRGSVSKV